MDPKQLFDNDNVDLECPNCKKQFSATMDDVLTRNKIVNCPHCEASITIDNSQSIDDLSRKLDEVFGTLNKTININLKL